jgi:hypothetical protein
MLKHLLTDPYNLVLFIFTGELLKMKKNQEYVIKWGTFLGFVFGCMKTMICNIAMSSSMVVLN